MKKVIVVALGLMMVAGFANNVTAVESQFGGYWRTRMFVQDEFNQDGSYFSIDNRTRLYYTAKFSDDFKFVNKFEFNSIWGDDEGGDIGADGDTFRVKNSYADFTMGSVNTKLGIQGAILARGFLFDDDFSGIVITPQFGDVTVPFGYMAVRTEDGGNAEFDEAVGFIEANFKISETLGVSPYFVYWGAGEGEDLEGVTVGDWDAYYVGLDLDMELDMGSVWGSFIYNGGEYGDGDINGFLAAVGADIGIVHGQAFYATGDDDANDVDTDAFLSAPGQSYYWSEIMGYGVFDNAASLGSPNEKISNVAALNGGVTIKPIDKMTVSGDVWYAMLAEENEAGEDELGLELDGKITYTLMENLSADFILAYLIAGDATGDENVFEGGVRVSLKF